MILTWTDSDTAETAEFGGDDCDLLQTRVRITRAIRTKSPVQGGAGVWPAGGQRVQITLVMRADIAGDFVDEISALADRGVGSLQIYLGPAWAVLKGATLPSLREDGRSGSCRVFTLTITGLTMATSGPRIWSVSIPAATAVGLPVLRQPTIYPASIGATTAVGAPLVRANSIVLSSVAAATTIGLPSIRDPRVFPIGITPATFIGAPVVRVSAVRPQGIAAGTAVGSPAVGVPAWAAALDAGLLASWRASEGLTIAGGVITSWAAAVGGVDLAPQSVTAGPILDASLARAGFVPVRFTKDILRSDSSFLPSGAGARSISVLCRVVSVGSSIPFSHLWATGSQTDYGYVGLEATTNAYAAKWSLGIYGHDQYSSQDSISATAQLLTFTYDGAEAKLFLGTAQIAALTCTLATPSSALDVGGWGTQATRAITDAAIWELHCWNRDVSSDVAALVSWVNLKYGLSLT